MVSVIGNCELGQLKRVCSSWYGSLQTRIWWIFGQNVVHEHQMVCVIWELGTTKENAIQGFYMEFGTLEFAKHLKKTILVTVECTL